jgi:type I restriction enzyme S subunit
VVGGATPSTSRAEFWEGGELAFCTPKDMSRLTSPVLLDTERHITLAGVEQISSGQLPVGTVLLSSRAPIGYLAIAEMSVSVNQGIIAMKSRNIPSPYLLFWTASNMDAIEARAGGSTFAEINKQNFRPIPALRPDERTLAAFGDITLPLFDLIVSNQRESVSLTSLRDTLLPNLISGGMRLVDSEGAADGR